MNSNKVIRLKWSLITFNELRWRWMNQVYDSIESKGSRIRFFRPWENRWPSYNTRLLTIDIYFNRKFSTRLVENLLLIPMSSKSPRFGWLIAIFKKIDDYIAVNKTDYFVEVFTNQDLSKQKTDTKFSKSTILSR